MHMLASKLEDSIMKGQIIESTICALRNITAPRFFKSERGYQGIFYCALYKELEHNKLVNEDRIIEMEYQKSRRHELTQRPDIIFHIPVEHSGGRVKENNFAVWAIKARSNMKRAKEDFIKLDEMFDTLNYPLGFFININSDQHHLDLYDGPYKDRLLAFSVISQDNSVIIKMAWFDNNELKEEIR